MIDSIDLIEFGVWRSFGFRGTPFPPPLPFPFSRDWNAQELRWERKGPVRWIESNAEGYGLTGGFVGAKRTCYGRLFDPFFFLF